MPSACGRRPVPDRGGVDGPIASSAPDGSMVRMAEARWQQLFEDLAAQQAALEQRERAAEIAEHTRAERGTIELAHRLVAGLDEPLRLRVRGVGWVGGVLTDVGADWLLLDGQHSGPTGRELLVPLRGLLAVEGLTRRAETDEGAARRRLGLRHAVRVVSRDRSRVRVHDLDGDHVTGTIDAVHADHLDLSRHADDEPRRDTAVRGRISVPYAVLTMVRRL